ncbi:MAG TPA: YceI family protein [Saprospiraceae bacterium]|nr:YceI family protein [Saprospiraceae bacterium]
MKTTILIRTLVLGGWLLGASFHPTPDPSPTGRGDVENTDDIAVPSTEHATSPLLVGEGLGVGWNDDGVFRCENGKISFKSDAPLEVISAKSGKLRGVIDTTKQTFAWSVDIKTFEGFNSPLQREHFNENYMESKKYPKASFSGKIIEKIDFQKNGTYAVRAKGQLNIHGIEQERIIKSQLEVNDGKLRVQATFTVPLTDHNITIPKVVYQKIAEEVAITVNAELTGN